MIKTMLGTALGIIGAVVIVGSISAVMDRIYLAQWRRDLFTWLRDVAESFAEAPIVSLYETTSIPTCETPERA
jgi:ABC-type transporter Mla maintaining outer membrane lipid asymmetry permease subunit MlaE